MPENKQTESTLQQIQIQRHLSFQNIKNEKRPSISDKITQQRMRSPSLQAPNGQANSVAGNYNASSSTKEKATGEKKTPILNVHQDTDVPKSCLSSAIDVPSLANVHPSFNLSNNDTSEESNVCIHQSRKNSIQHNNPIIKYLSRESDNKIHLLIGITGCIATSKILTLINKLFEIYTEARISIQLVLTPNAEHFLKPYINKIPSQVKVWFNDDEFDIVSANNNLNIKNTFENSMLHIELRRWADLMLLAPLSANTLAKITNGINDNLLTNIIRTWNPQKEIIAALGINNLMYSHPLTARQLKVLKEDFPFFSVLKPVEKISDYDGNISMGGMRECVDIVGFLTKKLGQIDEENENDNDEDDQDQEEGELNLEEEDDDDDDAGIEMKERFLSNNSDSDSLVSESDSEYLNHKIGTKFSNDIKNSTMRLNRIESI